MPISAARPLQSPPSPLIQDFVNDAVRSEARALAQIPLALLWQDLVIGRLTVVGNFFSATRCGLLLQRAPAPKRALLSGRRLEIVESVLCGISQYCVALDLQLAPSTVALNARNALDLMGAEGRPSRAHPLLMLAALAARHRAPTAASFSQASTSRGNLEIVGIPRPGRRLPEYVPEAERAVITMLVEGLCYADIAKRRGTSERTIANQIAATFRRLNLSGRSALIHRLFALDGVGPLASGRPDHDGSTDATPGFAAVRPRATLLSTHL